MLCPYCTHPESKVIDSREADNGESTRRRRECAKCEKRFTTYERVEKTARLVVVKKDGTRTPFDGTKILAGIQTACGKRPVPEDAKRTLAQSIEDALHREFEKEVDSHEIGVRVARALRRLDRIAALRFASELYEFKDLQDFMREAEDLAAIPDESPTQQRLFDDGEPAPGSAPPPAA